MKMPPNDADDKPAPYWTRGPRTRFHRYYYPADNRIGVALMLLIGLLGVVAIVVALSHMRRSLPLQDRDLRLAGCGVVAASVGLYQSLRLLRRSDTGR